MYCVTRTLHAMIMKYLVEKPINDFTIISLIFRIVILSHIVFNQKLVIILYSFEYKKNYVLIEILLDIRTLSLL